MWRQFAIWLFQSTCVRIGFLLPLLLFLLTYWWYCCCCYCRLYSFCVLINFCVHFDLWTHGPNEWALGLLLLLITSDNWFEPYVLLFLCWLSFRIRFIFGSLFSMFAREGMRGSRKEVIESNQPNDISWYCYCVCVRVFSSSRSHFTQFFSMSANKLYAHGVSGVISETKRVIRREKLIIRWFNPVGKSVCVCVCEWASEQAYGKCD